MMSCWGMWAVTAVLGVALVGCGANEGVSPSAGERSTSQRGATSGSSQPGGLQDIDKLRGIPAWVGHDSDEPFPVREFLESREPPRDNAAPLYRVALLPHPGFEQIRDLADVEKLQAGTVSLQQVERALQAIAPVLDQVDVAQQRSSCVFRTEFSWLAIVEYANYARMIARAAVLQLYLARETHDNAMALASIGRSLRLSRDLRPRGGVICQLVSLANDERIVDSVMRLTLHDPMLTAKQCDQLLSLFIEHHEEGWNCCEEGVCVEYLMCRQMIEDIQTGRLDPRDLQEFIGDVALELLPGRLDFPAEKAACNRLFTIGLEESRGSYRQCMGSLRLEAELDRLESMGTSRRRDVSRFVPIVATDFQGFKEAVTRSEAALAALQLAIAVRRYELVHQCLPRSLEDAIAETALMTVPLDPYSGQPMKYVVAEGRPTVYSVGKDMRDDGGRTDWEFGQQPGDSLFALEPFHSTDARPHAEASSGTSSPRRSSRTSGHGAAAMRVWTSTVGSRLEAEFVDLEGDGKVAVLKKQNGALLRVPIAKLSEQDRRWIQLKLGED